MKVLHLCYLTRISLLDSGEKPSRAICTRSIYPPPLLYPGRRHSRPSTIANHLFPISVSLAAGLMLMCRRTNVVHLSPSPGSASSSAILLITRGGSAGIRRRMKYSSAVMCALWRLRCLVLNLGCLALVMSHCEECSQAQWENLLAMCWLRLFLHLLCHLLILPALTLITLIWILTRSLI